MNATRKVSVALSAMVALAALACQLHAQTNPATRTERPARRKFIQTFLAYQSGGAKLVPGDAQKLAKFDILNFGRFRHGEINGDTYAAVRAINPDVQIYIYQHGPDVWASGGGKRGGKDAGEATDEMDVARLNNIARFNNARGHSMGNLNTDNLDLFLLSAEGKRCHTYHKDYRYLMDFGSEKFHTYWLEATAADILDRPWAGDGIFVDNTAAMQWGYECDTPAKYNTDNKWVPAMHKFQLAIAAGLHARGVKLWTNTCCTPSVRGNAEWLALDAEPDPPDLLGEEGAFAHGWGGNKFYPENKWKRQVDVMGKLTRCGATMFCHTTLAEGASGTDQYGKPVTYWQTLYYALGSFLLGKNDELNNAYFYFFTRATGLTRIYWYDEYERIDLGAAMGPYQVTQFGGTNIYWRQFERGYVYVNPTNNDVSSIPLPAACKQLAHETINDDPATLPDIESIGLKSHHAAILLESAFAVDPDAGPQAQRSQ